MSADRHQKNKLLAAANNMAMQHWMSSQNSSPVRLLAQDGDRSRSLRLDSAGDLDWRPGPLPDADPEHPREADLAAGARDRQLTKTRRERRSLATTRPQRRDHNADRVVRLEGDKRRCLPN